jgi:HEAT repeat protein
VSTRVGPLAAFADPFRPNLEALVRNLDLDAARSKRLIRQLLEEDRDKFYRTAIPLLRAGLESAGAQYVVGTLCAAGLLVRVLGDPLLTREQALAVAQVASRVDSNAEMALARALSDTTGAPDAGEHVEEHARLIEILAAISDGAKIFPCLVRLLRHPNPHIRSKAVLMIGRGNRSANWVRQRLGDSDPRIRANAAEALWGVNSAEARELLQTLVHDSNNRVAGNAMLGLYRLGDQTIIPEILALAHHDSPMFRATAAWVMGASGDPRFTEALANLLRETHPVVRKRAFAALGCVRSAVRHAREGAPWRLFARMLAPDAARPGKRLTFGVVREDGSAPPPLLPTNLLVSEDGQPVTQYRMVERPLPETMSIVFVLPRAAGRAVLACLPRTRPTDLWGFVYYTRETPAGAPGGEGRPRFHSSPEAIAAELERVPPAAECADLWQSVARAVDMEGKGIAGKLRVIVLNDPAPRPSASEALAGAVVAAQAFVQTVSYGPDGAVEEFCRRVSGLYREADDPAVVDAYLNVLARYEVSYQPVNPAAATVKLRLCGPGLYAETQLAKNGED